jgi:SET domain-containing protein
MDNFQLTTELLETFIYRNYKKNYMGHWIQSVGVDGSVRLIDIYRMRVMTSIFPIELDTVYISPSRVHGLGVFAKRDIKKDELLTFYPGDLLGYTPNKDRHIDNHLLFNYPSKRFKAKGGTIHQKGYSIVIDDYFMLNADPSFNENPTYAGHLINDGARCPPKNPKGAEIYQKISLMKANCRFQTLKENLHLSIVSTRDIKKDEEIFVSYGVNYWEHNA